MARLEKHPCVRGLSFTSFLILPFQRITRLKLLVQVRRVNQETTEHHRDTLHSHFKQWEISKYLFEINNFNFLKNIFFLQNILKKAEEDSEREVNAIKAHQRLEQVTTRGRRGGLHLSRFAR